MQFQDVMKGIVMSVPCVGSHLIAWIYKNHKLGSRQLSILERFYGLRFYSFQANWRSLRFNSLSPRTCDAFCGSLQYISTTQDLILKPLRTLTGRPHLGSHSSSGILYSNRGHVFCQICLPPRCRRNWTWLNWGLGQVISPCPKTRPTESRYDK